MSYELYLTMNVDSWETVDRLVEATAGPGFVPVVAGRRRSFFRERAPQAQVDPDAAQKVAGDLADWDAETSPMTADGREALARTVLAVGEIVGEGWALRSSWTGLKIEHEPVVTAEQLADVVRRCALRQDTMYWVGRAPQEH